MALSWSSLLTLAYLLGTLWGWCLIPIVIMERKSAVATVAWLLTLAYLPIVGPLLYLWLGHARIERRVGRRRRLAVAIQEQLLEMRHRIERHELLSPGKTVTHSQEDLLRATNALGDFPITTGNSVTVLTQKEAIFDSIARAMHEARSSIHLEYYAFQQDETGTLAGSLLAAAAQRGVECRLLVDSYGSWSLQRRFHRQLRQAGVHVAWFLPFELPIPTRRWNWNLRNHRKIAVIDGALALTGSGNIGDEYRKRRGRYDDCEDVQLLLCGPAVHHLQEIFAEDWYHATKEDLSRDAYFPHPESAGTHTVQVVPSGPDQEHPPIRDMICAAIHASHRSVHLIAPYFVPDEPFLVALSTAALRGKEVIVVVPRRTDHRIVDAARCSYYQELLRSGVRILEYPRNILHTKAVIIDSLWATTGSTNLDPRSFHLNFEVNVNLYDPELVAHLEDFFQSVADASTAVTLEDVRRWSLRQRFLQNTARVFSPML